MSDSKDATSLDDKGTTCATCGTPATNKCAGCKASTYCGKGCQTKDWPAHKSICKDLQVQGQLARVAELVHGAYLTFRENTWDTTIIKIEDRDDALVIHDGDPWTNPQGFSKFPHDLIPKNKRAKLGVLTAWTCDEPFAFMNTLMIKLLQGERLHSTSNYDTNPCTDLNVDIEEIGVKFKAVPRKTIAIHHQTGEPHSNWPDYQHTMLRLTSRKSRKQWVMDLAGGQYGITEPLHAWTKYKENYVEKVVSVYEVGANKRIIAEVAKISGIPTLSYGLAGRAAEQVDEAIDTWETEHQPLSTLKALSDTDFRQQKTLLLHSIDEVVRTFIASNDFSAVVRKAKADDSPINNHIIMTRIQKLSSKKNLLLQKTLDKPSPIDRLCGDFGAKYSYHDGAGDDEALRRAKEKGLHHVELGGSDNKSGKTHHIFFDDLF